MTLLPFDNAIIGLQQLPAAEVIPGSGTYRENGRDIATTTADGRIHHDRQAILRRAQLEARGDHTALDTPNGQSQAVVLRRGSTDIAAFSGLVTATYHAQRQTTTLDIVGDPLTD